MKLKNLNYDVIFGAYVFSFLDEKLYFCAYIAESANVAGSAQYGRFFWSKTFGDIGPPVVLRVFMTNKI